MHTDLFVSMSEELDSAYHPVEASAAVSATGLLKASVLPPGLDADKVASLSAATAFWADKMAHGSVEQVFLKTAGSCLVMYYADNNKDLKVMARSCATCGENPNYCVNAMLDNP